MSELDGGGGGAMSPKQKKRPTIGFWSNSKDKAGSNSSSRKSQKGLFKKRTGKEGEGAVKGAVDGETLDNKVRYNTKRAAVSSC
jgi:hypothetical protein